MLTRAETVAKTNLSVGRGGRDLNRERIPLAEGRPGV